MVRSGIGYFRSSERENQVALSIERMWLVTSYSFIPFIPFIVMEFFVLHYSWVLFLILWLFMSLFLTFFVLVLSLRSFQLFLSLRSFQSFIHSSLSFCFQLWPLTWWVLLFLILYLIGTLSFIIFSIHSLNHTLLPFILSFFRSVSYIHLVKAYQSNEIKK